ncbi:MAG: translational GTPase TypA, partial [Bacteroidales bacterium]|nr:translational GTPase TypA [Bacteroidales bacterium]
DATEDQLDFPVVFGSAKEGWMSSDWRKRTDDISILLDYIIKYIPAPPVQEGTPQMLISSLEYSSYVGRIAIGRLQRGTLREGMPVTLMHADGTSVKTRIKELLVFEGLTKQKVAEVSSGDICALVGLDGFNIGDTVADFEKPEPLGTIAIDEPTMSMVFTINNSPFYGRDGKYVTSRHIKERLERELEKNIALRVSLTDSSDAFTVYGRGILHLSVLIETMRREGYELQVGQPKVIIKTIDGRQCEPIEELNVDVPEESAGKVIEMVTRRKGELVQMDTKADRVFLNFTIPSRGIIGLRNTMLTATAGEAVMTHRFVEFAPMRGDIEMRINGSLITMETGVAIPYALDKLQDHGKFFVDPGEEIYEGQVVGENTRPGDICLNLTKTKKLSNMRASGTDEKMKIAPAIKFSLEEALEYIQEDEYVEVTPHHIRLRKILLKEIDRKRQHMAASKS